MAANFYFGVVSSLALIAVCALLTERFVEPRLGQYRRETPPPKAARASHRRNRED